MEYDGNIDKLRGATRKGSTLIFDKQELVAAYNAREMRKERSPGKRDNFS